MAADITQIDLLRHGMPVGGKRYRGQVDDPLSEAGWGEMWAAVGTDTRWHGVISSPLSRCQAFAQALCETRSLPLEVEPRIMEIGFGAWEGRTKEELLAEDPEQLARFYHAPMSQQPAGAEPIEAFYERVTTAFDEWLERFSGKRLLVVAHAGTIRALVAHVLHAPLPSLFSIDVPSAGLTRVEKRPGRPPLLVFHGKTAL